MAVTEFAHVYYIFCKVAEKEFLVELVREHKNRARLEEIGVTSNETHFKLACINSQTMNYIIYEVNKFREKLALLNGSVYQVSEKEAKANALV